MGAIAAFTTILMVNGSPASLSVSDPLTGGLPNIPEAVKFTLGAVFGVAALVAETAKQKNAATVTFAATVLLILDKDMDSPRLIFYLLLSRKS
jgi:hypothetical protein